VRTDLVTAQATAIQLRPFAAADEPFMYELYADRRAPELRSLGWGPAEQRAFVDMQFRAQQSGYAAAYPDADHWVLYVGEERAGRLLVDRQPTHDTVVDVVVLSRYRGRGIGTALVEEVLADAEAAGRPCRLMVAAHDGRLIGWYERLGFVWLDDHGPYVGMERRPVRAREA
jgi:ribosomal protein S18 acetylase RimI-like enzyme